MRDGRSASAARRSRGHPVWSPQDDRLIAASDDAWRHLGWQGLDDDGVLTRWPLEIRGSIEEMTGRARAS